SRRSRGIRGGDAGRYRPHGLLAGRGRRVPLGRRIEERQGLAAVYRAPLPGRLIEVARGGIMDKVNLSQKISQFAEHWSPKIVGELNGQQVKLAKFLGPFVWHKHDAEDELFLVVKGRFRMEYRDHHIWLEEGEFLIVPRGVEHRLVADEEVHVLL